MLKCSDKDFTLTGYVTMKNGDVVLYISVNNPKLKKGYTYEVSMKWSRILNVELNREENKPEDCGCLLPPGMECGCHKPVIWINE